jgi:hypothetical protein
MATIAPMFDNRLKLRSGSGSSGEARLAGPGALDGLTRGVAGARARRAPGLAVPVALGELLPDGLQRGAVTGLDGDRYLAAGLVGAAIRQAGSAALVGVDDLGTAAVVAAGAAPARLVVVRSDAPTWARAVEVLIGAVEVVLVRPPGPVADAVARRITARLRRTAPVATALIVAGGAFPAPVRLRVAAAQWSGLEIGHGLLEARRVSVVAERRDGSSRAVQVYLPGVDGAVVPAWPAEAAPSDELAARRRRAA